MARQQKPNTPDGAEEIPRAALTPVVFPVSEEPVLPPVPAGAAGPGELPANRDDDALRLLAVKVLRKRLGQLRKEAAGVRENKDIEYVHRMRVASRRARTGLRLFEAVLGGEDLAPLCKGVKRITARLGDARDADVQIVRIEAFLKDLADTKARPGVERLLWRLRQRRAAEQKKVVRALLKFERRDTAGRLEGRLDEAQRRAKASGARLDAPANRARGGMLIAAECEGVLKYERYAERPERVAELHAMRIAVKHLRYALEIFEPVFGGAVKGFVTECKALQDLLGALHDDDVWLEFLPRFEKDERKRVIEHAGHAGELRRLRPGWRALFEAVRQHRQETYSGFVARWRRLRRAGFWRRLEAFAARSAAVGRSVPEAPVAPAAEASKGRGRRGIPGRKS